MQAVSMEEVKQCSARECAGPVSKCSENRILHSMGSVNMSPSDMTWDKHENDIVSRKCISCLRTHMSGHLFSFY